MSPFPLINNFPQVKSSLSSTFYLLETCDGSGCCWQGPSRYIVRRGLGRADGIKSWPEKYPSVEACAKRCRDLSDCTAFHYYGPGDEAYQDCYLHKGGIIGPQLEDGRNRMAGVCCWLDYNCPINEITLLERFR